MEFACRVQSLLAGAEVELGSGEDGAGPPVGISDITEPFVRHHSPLVGASRRSALKWGGQLTTAGLRGDRTRSSGSRMQGSRGTESGGRRGCAGLHALRGWSEEFTYSRPPGWLGPSW